jgi:dUTP pyrophosphatase
MDISLEQIKYTKVRTVKNPVRASSTDAGIDLFVPNFTNKFAQSIMAMSTSVWPVMKPNNLNKIIGLTIKPQGRILIPSGLHFRVPEGTALIAFNKSGIATKLGLSTGACVCDSSYQGEVHISLINTSNIEVEITPGMKIVQFLLVPVYHSEPKEIKTIEELYADHESERGAGGFGSTGDK